MLKSALISSELALFFHLQVRSKAASSVYKRLTQMASLLTV